MLNFLTSGIVYVITKSIFIWNKPIDREFDLDEPTIRLIATVMVTAMMILLSILGCLFIYFGLVAYQYLKAVSYGADLNETNGTVIYHHGKRYLLFFIVFLIVLGAL